MNLHLPNGAGSLYRPENERDACGVGAVAHVLGERSHRILQYGLQSCCNVVHRGAMEPDYKTGDGAGVLTQVPHKLLVPYAESEGVKIERPTDLGVGVFFLPGDDLQAQAGARQLAEDLIRQHGLTLIGWREVPVQPETLGAKARATLPKVEQVLVLRQPEMDDDKFERTLFVIRRRIERQAGVAFPSLYIPSFSHRTISYKALALPGVVREFYDDLTNPEFETAICLFHQRFSTNTFPSWPLGQPFRMLAHNGEINTLRGNRNWLNSSDKDFQSELWGDDVRYLREIIDAAASDSASLDAALELLVLSGRSLAHAMAMLVPPAWRIDPETTEEEMAFYQYHRCFQEPWDGPAALVYTDGMRLGASLDRNGLRPARFKLTDDHIFSIGSEVGTVEFDDSRVIRKGRLAPGEMILIDTESGQIKGNREIKRELAARRPYGEWLSKNRVEFNSLVSPEVRMPETDLDILTLTQRQVTFDVNKEEVSMILTPMVQKGQEPVYSMGDDAALSVLSSRPKLLPTYFKQLFAQVTNPPIDPIRERLVMTLAVSLGWQRNLIAETPEHARMLYLEHPILFDHELSALADYQETFPQRTLDITWPLSDGAPGLEKAVEALCRKAEEAADDEVRILILSDRAVDHQRVPIPALLAVGAVHHHLNRVHKRMRLSLVVDTGEVRDTHSAATMFGFGAQAICPYLAYESIREVLENDRGKKLGDLDYPKAVENYRGSLEKGVLKVMSKMGISVLSSYQGAQIFEAVGLSHELMDRCFTGTQSQVGGAGFNEIAEESIARHQNAFGAAIPVEAGDQPPLKLEDPGYNRYRREGERHAIGGPVIKNFHTFVRTGDPEKYEEYVEQLKLTHPVALKDLLEFVPSGSGAIPISDVEPIEDIRRRFTTAAMSLGALSPEAHEMLAVAMNRIGGKSDSGEGGEDARRFKPYENGDWANSKIKQVASGRFGVHTHYLVNAEELEIKMAQGAKPGEGGQLPGFKVNELIARLRHTQPGVTLISPPPHHDIYSIEDLAQLIHDLKEVNPAARVTVKLVAESGVGTVAAGVAKANADVILISGHDGGTGASPLSSIKHAGLPWELGLAETQQVLMLNDLRGRVTLRTDGGMRTGADIVKAAILGAEEYNFGTIAMIAMGCVYVRQCHLNNCPVGVATQDPKYRAKFKGEVEHVVNFFNAVAYDVRKWLAELGVQKLDDLIGRPEFLRQREVPDHPKANLIDLGPVLADLAKQTGQPDLARRCAQPRNDGIHEAPLDLQIIDDVQHTIEDGVTPVTGSYRVVNTNRDIGTRLSGEIAKRHGNHGIPDGTIDLHFTGSAGQSFGTFLCGGLRMTLTGEANDYVGKGMAGGEIIVRAPEKRAFEPESNSIIGNTVMYGATGGHAFINGRAGERFAVRNSGGVAVVEGVGDHGCEYMTNGLVVILGPTGKNFGAGMSGGLAFVLDEDGRLPILLNPEMVELASFEDAEDVETVKALIQRHFEYTASPKASRILQDWDNVRAKFKKVQPKQDLAAPPAVPEKKPKTEMAGA